MGEVETPVETRTKDEYYIHSLCHSPKRAVGNRVLSCIPFLPFCCYGFTSNFLTAYHIYIGETPALLRWLKSLFLLLQFRRRFAKIFGQTTGKSFQLNIFSRTKLNQWQKSVRARSILAVRIPKYLPLREPIRMLLLTVDQFSRIIIVKYCLQVQGLGSNRSWSFMEAFLQDFLLSSTRTCGNRQCWVWISLWTGKLSTHWNKLLSVQIPAVFASYAIYFRLLFPFTMPCDWFKKLAPLSRQRQSRVARTRFPALDAGCIKLLRVLIGSLCCFCLLWLARVITLGLRHSI